MCVGCDGCVRGWGAAPCLSSPKGWKNCDQLVHVGCTWVLWDGPCECTRGWAWFGLSEFAFAVSSVHEVWSCGYCGTDCGSVQLSWGMSVSLTPRACGNQGQA